MIRLFPDLEKAIDWMEPEDFSEAQLPEEVCPQCLPMSGCSICTCERVSSRTGAVQANTPAPKLSQEDLRS
jgi:hypothetical protein